MNTPIERVLWGLEKVIMLLRGTIYQLLRLQFRGWILLGRGAQIRGLRNLKIDGIVQFSDYSLIDARYADRVKFGDRCSVGQFSIIRASGSRSFQSPGILLGPGVSFGPFCNVGGGYGLTIGANCLFGPYVSLHPEYHNFGDTSTPIKSQGISGSGIVVGSDCWFGAKSTILDGATVGDGCIVAAASVVTRQVLDAYSIYAGSPSKKLRARLPAGHDRGIHD